MEILTCRGFNPFPSPSISLQPNKVIVTTEQGLNEVAVSSGDTWIQLRPKKIDDDPDSYTDPSANRGHFLLVFPSLIFRCGRSNTLITLIHCGFHVIRCFHGLCCLHV